MPVSGLTDDRRNFHCVTVASVDLIPPVLRDILTSHIQPVNLYNQIKLKNLNLRKEQQAICFIPPASGVPDYNKFDVTLLYTLIRNLCHLPCPAQGWGNPEGPEATDTQISDDIERLRLFRNKYYAHRISAKISDNEFKDIWGNLTSAISRIQSRYNVDYKDEVIRIEQSKYTLCHWQECVKILDALADKPDIIIKGENEIICGGTAKFEADVNNVESSSWSITWQRRREDNINCIDTTVKKYSGSKKRKLVINDVCKEDDGEYQALLSFESNGPEYKSRNTVRLYAVGEIPFLNISEVTSGSEGITIHFNCGVLDQSPKVHLIEWRKNGQELDTKSNKYVEEGINSRHLTITSPNYEDRGNYNCKVSNAVGSVSKNVMLDVPSVELLEVSPIVYGFKTTLKPVISSTPTPQKINWQTSKDGVDFHGIKKAKDSYHADSSLVIHKATFADKLYYRLNVWNGIGETTSNTVYLNVTGSSPNIKTISKTNIKKRSVKLIGNVIIYDDSPGVNTFFWTRNNKTIDFEECDGKLLETRTDNPSLTITNVGPDDAGEYRLTAINDVGSCTSEAIVLGIPKVSEEKVENEDKGGLWITVTIKSIPEPCHVQWSSKRKEDDTFAPIDINAKEYKGTTVTLPHPVLFVKQKDQLENICFRIEVSNFIGSTQQDISGDDTTKQRKIDSVENTIYNDDGRIFEFTMLSSALVKHFPPEKLDHLKFLIKNSNKVKNLTSVKEATSVLKCIDILQDENLFTPTDVIYMQFLCQEADCFDLDKKCVEYAKCKQRALCYFKIPPVNGYTDVQFHVQGDVSGYTKDYINHVIKTVAVILRCKEEDVLLNGAQHSKSFLLSLSIKEPYVRKLLALEVKDRLKLRGLNIDYLIIDGNILDIEIPKGKEAVFESNDQMNPMEKESTHSSMMRSQEDGASIDSKVKEIIVNELMLSPSTPPSTGETSMLPSPSTPPLPGPSTPSLPGPSKPSLPGPSKPSLPGPQTPSLPGPSTPSLPGPSKPSLPGPQTPSLPGPSAQDEDTNEKWDVQSIKLLKKSFHDIERTSKPLKNKWQKVASEVNRVGGYSFSAEKCRLKIKGLKSKYERQKKKNNTSGESPASDEDDEDFDVFEKIPDMKPKAVLESGTGTSKKRPAADDSSSEETEPLPVKKRVHPKGSAEILQVVFQDLMEERREKAEQRHQKKLATANSFIEALKELGKK